jgi:glycosyltransferase involved in cell wall biosynthesis
MSRRILIFSVAYMPFVGGAEIAVQEITNRLPEYEFEMITLNLDGRQKSREQMGRVLVHRIGGGGGMAGYLYKLLYPFMAMRLARQLHTSQPFDATWSIMASFSGFAGLFFKWSYPKIPFVLTLQEGDPLRRTKQRAFIAWPLFVRIFRRADRVQAISSYLADFAVSMGAPEPVVVIPNGVDLATFAAAKNLRRRNDHLGTTLITVSRLVEKNGVEDIIDALILLPESVNLVIVGTGPLEKRLTQKAAALALMNPASPRVSFVGLVSYSDVPQWLAKADIFIRPSLSEGLGNVFIEAMAAGLPVIATPVGGIVDFLRDGDTGLFCQPKDRRSIAQAVERLDDEQGLYQRLVENGIKLAAGYDWQIIAGRIKKEIFDPLFLK